MVYRLRHEREYSQHKRHGFYPGHETIKMEQVIMPVSSSAIVYCCSDFGYECECEHDSDYEWCYCSAGAGVVLVYYHIAVAVMGIAGAAVAADEGKQMMMKMTMTIPNKMVKMKNRAAAVVVEVVARTMPLLVKRSQHDWLLDYRPS